MSAKVILLDHLLGHYGPETNEIRYLLHRVVADSVWPQESTQPPRLGSPSTDADVLIAKLQGLSPKYDRQHSIQAQALSLAIGLSQTHWLMYEQEAGSVSKPLLVILVFWLTVIFLSSGCSHRTMRPLSPLCSSLDYPFLAQYS